jgi:CHASE2 domain-containing sensor protein/class 3 adenylate cyclase
MQAGAFTGFRLRATDAYFPSRGTDPRIMVVGIDRLALDAAATPWPWPREVQASMLRRVIDAGARLVVADVLYHPATPADDRVVEALQAGDVVIAEAGELSRVDGLHLLQARATTRPVPAIADAASGIGYVNITPDAADGVVRSLPIAVEDPEGEALPSLALAAAARLDGSAPPLTVRPHGVQIGNRLVPTREPGMLEINFTDALVPEPELGHYMSAATFLGGTDPVPSLEGKVVLIGLADPTLGDQHLTPADKEGGVPGVFVHANALNTVLTSSYLTPDGQAATLAWVFVLALAAVAIVRSRPAVAAVAAVVLAGAFVLIALVRFDRGQVTDLVYPLLAVGVSWVAGLGLRHVAEVRQRRRLATVLTQYVPASVARQLVGRGGDLPQGTLTFLFTDVVGSTRAWESWPKAMSQAMRVHDALIERSVEDSGGALVRPRGEGDSRFAVFVRPIDGAGAAMDIARRMGTEPWSTPEPVRIRMALHVGEAELREGDYYGSPVNRCARIRSLAGPGQIFISESTADAVRPDLPVGAELRDLGMQALKGVAEPEHVFELAVLDRSASPNP